MIGARDRARVTGPGTRPNASGYRFGHRIRKSRASREQEQLGMLDRGRPRAVAAGRHPVHRVHAQRGRGGEQFELTRGETGGPEIELALVPVWITDEGPLVQYTGRGVERFADLEETESKRSRERAEREAACGLEGGGDAAEHVGLVAPSEQAEPALAEADRGIELAVEIEVADVEFHEADGEAFRLRHRAGQPQEVW